MGAFLLDVRRGQGVPPWISWSLMSEPTQKQDEVRNVGLCRHRCHGLMMSEQEEVVAMPTAPEFVVASNRVSFSLARHESAIPECRRTSC
jgi:hypothetical protein